MRRDMSKVIVERPRRGHNAKNHMMKRIRMDMGYRSCNKNDYEIDDNDDYVDQEDIRSEDDAHVFSGYRASIKPRGRGIGVIKSLSENLNPLLRFLEKRVGKTWDEVRSEISLNIKANNAVQSHIMDHVKWFVKTENSDRWFLDEKNLPRYTIGSECHPYVGFYVDKKGFLRESKKSNFREFDVKEPEKYGGCYRIKEREDHPYNVLFLTRSKNKNWYFVRVICLNDGYFAEKRSLDYHEELRASAIAPTELFDLDYHMRTFVSDNWWNLKNLDNKKDVYNKGRYPKEIWQASQKEVDETLSGLYVEAQLLRS